jgi:hypothetical protein
MTRPQVFDLSFLEARPQLVIPAAFLDRMSIRTLPSPSPNSPRVPCLPDALTRCEWLLSVVSEVFDILVALAGSQPAFAQQHIDLQRLA